MSKHLGLIALAAMIVGCGAQPQASPRVEPGALAPQSFARHWTATPDIGNRTIHELHVTPEQVFAYTRDNQSYMLNRAGGHLEGIHSMPRDTRLFAPVVFQDRVIYPTSAALQVYTLRGRRLDPIPLARAARGPAVGREPFIYIGLDYPGGGRVIAIDTARTHAHTQWERMTFGGVSARPAVVENTIYAASEDGRLYAIQTDGSPAWGIAGSYFATDGRILGDVAADRTGVYFASTDTKLYSLDRNSGRVQWIYFAGAALTEGPIVFADMVYQQVPGQGLVAIDKLDGAYHRAPLWIDRDGVRLLSQDDRHAYVQRRDNRIVALDKRSGEVRWQSDRIAFRIFATNLHDEMIYAATRGGEIVAIRPVLRAGTVGELVMELVPMPLAMAD